MSIGNGCLYEFSVDRLYEVLSEGLPASASETMLDILDVCRTFDQRECPGIAKMMTETASTELAYKKIGPVVHYPPDYSLHLMVAPNYRRHPINESSPEAVAADVAG
jgi:hypothetical protein